MNDFSRTTRVNVDLSSRTCALCRDIPSLDGLFNVFCERKHSRIPVSGLSGSYRGCYELFLLSGSPYGGVLESELLLALLGLPEGSPTTEESFLQDQGLSEDRTRAFLEKASHLGYVTKTDECLRVSQQARLSLAVKCLSDGIDIERVCKTAGWREFEDLVALIAESNGYATTKHLRFKSGTRRYEIDVLALGTPWSLVIECKRWRRSQQAALRSTASVQREKASLLAEALPNLGERVGRRIEHSLKLVPVVLMLSDVNMKTENGVPMVPIVKFQSFVEGFPGYVEDFAVITTRASRS